VPAGVRLLYNGLLCCLAGRPIRVSNRRTGWRDALPVPTLGLVLSLLTVPHATAFERLTPTFREGALIRGAHEGAVNQVFQACIAQASFGDGLFVVFQLQFRGALDLGLAYDEWLIAPGARTTVRLRLDGGLERQGEAAALRGLFVIVLGRDPAFLAALQSTRRLEVIGASGTVVYDLRGSGGGRVLVQLEECIRQQGG